MDRNIPHVRDIFGGPWVQDKTSQIQLYNHSPRSRRRRDNIEDFLEDNRPEGGHPRSASSKRPEKKNGWTKDNEEEYIKSKEEEWNKKSSNGHYSSRTLTDKDIRHLERHLSMKKTIRKQISRNLAQAFVEDPKCIQSIPDHPTRGNNKERDNDKSFTLTRAKMSKSEQNVLDMLKTSKQDSSDSGHSSPVGSFEEEVDPRKHRTVLKPLNDQGRRSEHITSDAKVSSFWKKFNLLGKNKR